MIKLTLVVAMLLLGLSVYPGGIDLAFSQILLLALAGGLATGYAILLFVAVLCDLSRLTGLQPKAKPDGKKPLDVRGGLRSAVLMGLTLCLLQGNVSRMLVWAMSQSKLNPFFEKIQPGETLDLEGADRWAGPYRAESVGRDEGQGIYVLTMRVRMPKNHWMGYGFARRPSATGTPFGWGHSPDYRRTQLSGAWYVFQDHIKPPD